MPEVDKTIEEGKIWAFIGYWGILFLVPLLAKKENKFAFFHGKQGLVLFVLWIIFWIIGFIPVVGIISTIGFLLCIILAIVGMIMALQGKTWKMPILGDIAEKINF